MGSCPSKFSRRKAPHDTSINDSYPVVPTSTDFGLIDTVAQQNSQLTNALQSGTAKVKSIDIENQHGTNNLSQQNRQLTETAPGPSTMQMQVTVVQGAFQNAHNFEIKNSSFYDVHGNLIINAQTPQLSNSNEKYRVWLMHDGPDPSTNHNIATKIHLPNTGSWLLKHHKYIDWKEKPNSFMWIHGISGAGKTVLFSTIVEDISPKHSIGRAYFYCDVSDVRKRKVTDILSSLVIHLLAWEPHNQSLLDKAYKDCQDGLSKPSDEGLLEILGQFISGFEKTYILVDALDECLNMEEIMSLIETLHKLGLMQCHLLVTSRRELQIVDAIMPMEPIEIDMCQMPVDADIEMYINAMLHSSPELKRWSKNDKNLIRSVLLDKANGMFRWVACQLEELKKCTKRAKTLKLTLENLPMTLEATYDRILSSIPPADAPDAVKLLLWLAFAEHPLHINYLAIIVEYDMEHKEFDADARLTFPLDVLKICSSLVTRMSDNTVQLAHASVKTYIVEKPRVIPPSITMDPSIGHSFIGQCCLAYVLCSRESHSDVFREDYEQSLIRYSARYWPKHILAGNQEQVVMEQMKKLFDITSSAFQNWVMIHNRQCFLSTYPWMNSSNLLNCAAYHGLNMMVEFLVPSADTSTEIADALMVASDNGHISTVRILIGHVKVGGFGSALQNAAYHGHKGIVDLLLENGADLNEEDGYYGTAMTAASGQGHKDIVELLIERGAAVDEEALHAASSEGHKDIVEQLLERAGVNGETGYMRALHAASYKGSNDIVELLLERGADVNAQGENYGNALQAASFGGHKDIVELLLERGANVDALGGEYGNALQAASCYGSKEIIELLLQRGVDVNRQGGKYGNALQGASSRGHKDVVELLLQKGADVSAQGGMYGNALQAASYTGHKDVVELLLQKGADANVQGGMFENALQAASSNGKKDIVVLLLQWGVDVNHGVQGNALQAALACGHRDIVELLLQNGADVNAQGGSALHAASCSHHNDLVELLLQMGVDVNRQGGMYGNALQAASFNGQEGLVELLLQKGADVNAQGGKYGNALQAAAYRGHNDDVVLLLQKGADVNAQGGKYGNALQAASFNGHKPDLVELLLQRGADVNAHGGEYGNALQAASSGNYKDIVELLLQRGAKVNAQGGRYGNALQAASWKNNKDIAELLLERGADVNAQGAGDWNALLETPRDRIDVRERLELSLLLGRGVDLNAQGGRYGNALHAASWMDNGDIVELLLEQGADVHAQGGKYGNALQAASFLGHLGIMKLLLKSGANASCCTTVQIVWWDSWDPSDDDKGQFADIYNALQAASWRGHKAAVQILLDSGVEQKHLDIALHTALDRGHKAIVDLLLENGAKEE